MEDNKNLNGSENTEELDKELEDLAELFRRELAKTTAEYEEGKSSDDAPQKASEFMEQENSCEEENQSSEVRESQDEKSICARCGKSFVKEKSDYCTECGENLRRIPLRIDGLIVAVVMLVAAVFSVMSFCGDIEGYDLARDAKEYADIGYMNSALEKYTQAIQYFGIKDVNAKKLHLEKAQTVFSDMAQGSASMNEVCDIISDALDDTYAKLPIYNNMVDLYNESASLYGTMQTFYGIMSKQEYAGYTVDNTDIYNAIIADVDSLVGTEIVITSVDGKNEEKVIANEGMVRFCQYMVAYTSERHDDAEKYLRMVQELEPDYVWLYAYELALIEINHGNLDEAEALAQKLIENNREDTDGYDLYSVVYRVSGDIDNAIAWADIGLVYDPTNTELLRHKAMACVVNGDIKEAEKIIEEALMYNAYGSLYYTAVVIETEAGDTETADIIIENLGAMGLGLPDKVKSYLDGSKTAKQLFTEGTGEAE